MGDVMNVRILNIWALVMIMLSAIDIATTYIIMYLGGGEANFIVAYYMKRLGVGWALFGVGPILNGLVVAIMWMYGKYHVVREKNPKLNDAEFLRFQVFVYSMLLLMFVVRIVVVAINLKQWSLLLE